MQGCEGWLSVGGRGRKTRSRGNGLGVGVSETVWDRWMPFCITPVSGGASEQ